jgi:predicted membrane protein
MKHRKPSGLQMVRTAASYSGVPGLDAGYLNRDCPRVASVTACNCRNTIIVITRHLFSYYSQSILYKLLYHFTWRKISLKVVLGFNGTRCSEAQAWASTEKYFRTWIFIKRIDKSSIPVMMQINGVCAVLLLKAQACYLVVDVLWSQIIRLASPNCWVHLFQQNNT